MKAKQYYDCFPECNYNTTYGSLLIGRNSINPIVEKRDNEYVWLKMKR